MSLNKAQEAIAVPANVGGDYNRNAVGRDRGGDAVDRPIWEFEPERVFVFRPGASLK